MSVNNIYKTLTQTIEKITEYIESDINENDRNQLIEQLNDMKKQQQIIEKKIISKTNIHSIADRLFKDATKNAFLYIIMCSKDKNNQNTLQYINEWNENKENIVNDYHWIMNDNFQDDAIDKFLDFKLICDILNINHINIKNMFKKVEEQNTNEIIEMYERYKNMPTTMLRNKNYSKPKQAQIEDLNLEEKLA